MLSINLLNSIHPTTSIIFPRGQEKGEFFGLQPAHGCGAIIQGGDSLTPDLFNSLTCLLCAGLMVRPGAGWGSLPISWLPIPCLLCATYCSTRLRPSLTVQGTPGPSGPKGTSGHPGEKGERVSRRMIRGDLGSPGPLHGSSHQLTYFSHPSDTGAAWGTWSPRSYGVAGK